MRDDITLPLALNDANAFRHMVHAPVWMTDMQAKGTPGRQAHWNSSDGRAPLLNTLTHSLNADVAGAANFTRALEWCPPPPAVES